MSKERLSFPPFPPLKWDHYFWEGELNLPSWAGFQSRRGSYAMIDTSSSSDGTVQLNVSTDNDRPGPISPEQVQAFSFLIDRESSIAESILTAIFSAYPGMRQRYVGYLEDANQCMPEIGRFEDLRPLVGLSQVHLLREASGGQAYIGFEFGCTWDREHGLGVMTHRDRVVEVGGADTSFLSPDS
jgi:hypothetical protein